VFVLGLATNSLACGKVLPNPSELLKIAADHFPGVQVLATGSSTLGASSRFRDTLAGRKMELWLTPMVGANLEDFGKPDLPHRLLHGGLPPFFLSSALPEDDFQEWLGADLKRELLVVTTDASPAFTRDCEGRRVRFLTLERLVERLAPV